jgi:hypothetical protein
MNYNQIPASDEDAQIQKAYRQRPELLAITSEQRGPVLPHFRCSLETVKGRRYVERAGVAPINLQTTEMEIRDRTNAYLLCQEFGVQRLTSCRAVILGPKPFLREGKIGHGRQPTGIPSHYRDRVSAICLSSAQVRQEDIMLVNCFGQRSALHFDAIVNRVA